MQWNFSSFCSFEILQYVFPNILSSVTDGILHETQESGVKRSIFWHKHTLSHTNPYTHKADTNTLKHTNTKHTNHHPPSYHNHHHLVRQRWHRWGKSKPRSWQGSRSCWKRLLIKYLSCWAERGRAKRPFGLIINHFHLWSSPLSTSSLSTSSLSLGTLSERKTGLCGKNSQTSDPLPPPPQFGNALFSKKKGGLFFVLGPKEHFWSSPKNHNFGW